MRPGEHPVFTQYSRSWGFDVSERTVFRYMPKRKPSDDQIKKWKRFLSLHAKYITAMDFFKVPTAMFQALYVFFILHHESRKILHFNVTAHLGGLCIKPRKVPQRDVSPSVASWILATWSVLSRYLECPRRGLTGTGL